MALIANSDFIKSVKVKTIDGEVLEFKDGENNTIIGKDSNRGSVTIIFKDNNDYYLNKVIELSGLPMEKEFYTLKELKEKREK